MPIVELYPEPGVREKFKDGALELDQFFLCQKLLSSPLLPKAGDAEAPP